MSAGPTHDAAVARPGAGRRAAGRAPATAERPRRRGRAVASGRRSRASCLLVTREYEHLRRGARASGRPDASMPLPHPSGLAVDRGERVHVASTRNPNQVSVELAAAPTRRAAGGRSSRCAPRSIPGALYLHDLALVGGVLHGNAVGQNAVVRLDRERRTSASGGRRRSRREAGPGLRAELPPAELDRRRRDHRIVVLLRLGRPDVDAPAGPPQLSRRPPRRDLLRARRASRSSRGPDPAALGAPARRRAVGRQQRLRRGRRRRRRRASRPWRGCRAGRAASRSPATSRSSAPRA